MFEKISNFPNPYQILMDPASLVVISIFVLLILAEELFPGRPLPKIKNWKVKGLLSFVIYFYLSTYLPMFWYETLAEYQLFDMTGLGDFGGGLVALLIYELGVYFWHRSMHKSHLLWKVFHQMHHSAERVDVYGAYYFSPMDMIGFTFLTSLAMVVVGGFTAQATIYAIYGATFLGVIQHTNIKTPQWMGYIFQRPEAHSLHHAKGVHAFNYSDLPLFDLILGTFKNPKEYATETGFYDGASSKIGDMVMFRDINVKSSIESN
jgi:sterol desaturase/sphingolipid hydroxylase (fatty acid hydroxylase superfamily)